MVRACRPPAREPARSWLARRSTMATSTPANANSPASISPVGPPPAITTACSAIHHPFLDPGLGSVPRAGAPGRGASSAPPKTGSAIQITHGRQPRHDEVCHSPFMRPLPTGTRGYNAAGEPFVRRTPHAHGDAGLEQGPGSPTCRTFTLPNGLATTNSGSR